MREEMLSNKEIAEEVKNLSESNSSTLQAGIKYPVLIVDDDKMMQKYFKNCLETWGFSTICASDAYTGLASAVKNRPLLIFLDIYMPEVNGEVMLKMLKAIEMTQNIPIIIISGNLNIDVLGTTYKDGASGFISKPFTQEVLYKKIKENLNPMIFGKMKENGLLESEIE